MTTRAVKGLGEIEFALVGPMHKIAEQIRQTVLAVARRAGHVSLEGRVSGRGPFGVSRTAH